MHNVGEKLLSQENSLKILQEIIQGIYLKLLKYLEIILDKEIPVIDGLLEKYL